jgi:hypothetical protein
MLCYTTATTWNKLNQDPTLTTKNVSSNYIKGLSVYQDDERNP